MRFNPRLVAAIMLVAASSPVAGQGTGPASGTAGTQEACARFDAQESGGRDQVNRRIADIDAAAAAGDMATFCRATSDLLFVYRAMRDAAAQCSAERAARWVGATSQTESALAGTCP